jgi:hypothetical protein
MVSGSPHQSGEPVRLGSLDGLPLPGGNDGSDIAVAVDKVIVVAADQTLPRVDY